MSTRNKILTFVGSAVLSFLPALLLTMVAWAPFEAKSFDCWDRMDGFFWDSSRSHQLAGDKLLNGYTWEQIGAVQAFYIGAFFTAWLVGSGGLSLVWIKGRKSLTQPV